MANLPSHVITEDHRLDQAATSAQEALADLRWHWTLDETNPDRVSFRRYAEAVGRSDRAIGNMARGYAMWTEGGANDIVRTRSLTDCIELAKLGEESRAATEATAEAMGLSVGNVASAHRDKVKETIRAAHEAAERRGTSVEEEMPRVARLHEDARQARARDKVPRSRRYVQIEGHLSAAKDRLRQALDAAHDVDLEGEEVDLIVDMLHQVAATLRLLDARFTGDSGTDWDAEKDRLVAGGDR